MNPLPLRCLPLLACLALAQTAAAEDARFFRGVVLNGPALTIDGNAWDGKDAQDFSATGKMFENQSVTLRPATDAARARMIRASRWGDKVDLAFAKVPPGAYQVFLYVWEDTLSERFKLLVNDRVVVEEFNSGSVGMWKRLGPWPAESAGGAIKISARAASHGRRIFREWKSGAVAGRSRRCAARSLPARRRRSRPRFLKVKSDPCSRTTATNATARGPRKSKAG